MARFFVLPQFVVNRNLVAMKRPTPIIRSLTENPAWIKKQCGRCGRDFWVLPSKSETLKFCAKDCRVRPALERLMEKITKTPDGHWLWTGALGDHGYGNIKDDEGKQWRVHRLSWTLHVGPIPDGMHVLHKQCCIGHTNCANPDHLYLGDDADNSRDRMECGRHRSY